MSITAAVGVDGLLTDNALVTPTDTKTDFVVRSWFELDAKVSSSRMRAAIFGAVLYDAYVDQTDLSGWSFDGHGDASVDLVPEILTIEAQGAVLHGSISTFGAAASDRAGTPGRVAIGTYAVGPQLTVSLGDVADFSADARFSQILYWTQDRQTEGELPQDATFLRATAQLDTAERSRRLQLLTTAEVVDDDNGYSLANLIQSAYVRVSPSARLIVRGGYEHVEQTRIDSLDAPVLIAGFEWRPNELSRVSVEGGTRYDHANWTADVDVQVGRAITLSGFWREAVQPDQIFQAESFATALEVSPGTPAPPAGPTGGVSTGTLKLDSNLYDALSRIKTGELRAAFRGDINALVLTGNWTDRKFLPDGGEDRTLIVNLTYGRRVRPDLSLTFAGEYAHTFESPTFGENASYQGVARASYLANSTTQFDLRLFRRHGRQYGPGGENITENAIAVAIRKTL